MFIFNSLSRRFSYRGRGLFIINYEALRFLSTVQPGNERVLRIRAADGVDRDVVSALADPKHVYERLLAVVKSHNGTVPLELRKSFYLDAWANEDDGE